MAAYMLTPADSQILLAAMVLKGHADRVDALLSLSPTESTRVRQSLNSLINTLQDRPAHG